MAKFSVPVAGLLISVLATLGLGSVGLAGGSVKTSNPHIAYPNFACAGYGNWGVCVGPPTKAE